jgi:putative membrane protein
MTWAIQANHLLGFHVTGEIKMKAGILRLLTVLFFYGCTQYPMDGSGRGWGHMMGYGGYGGIFIWLILILIAGVIIYVAVNRSRGAGGRESSAKESPIEILKRRYASGEISEAEFTRMKKELER